MYERVEGTDTDRIVAGTVYRRRRQERLAGLEDVVFVSLEADPGTWLERTRDREAPIDETAVHVV